MNSGLYVYYETTKNSIIDFLNNIEQEGKETKEAFYLLVHSINTGVDLTEEEKDKIGEQLKDVFKTIGVVSLAALPGISLVFLLTTYFKLNKYILPSSFQEKNKQ
jgi:hypothetical protein